MVPLKSDDAGISTYTAQVAFLGRRQTYPKTGKLPVTKRCATLTFPPNADSSSTTSSFSSGSPTPSSHGNVKQGSYIMCCRNLPAVTGLNASVSGLEASGDSRMLQTQKLALRFRTTRRFQTPYLTFSRLLGAASSSLEFSSAFTISCKT